MANLVLNLSELTVETRLVIARELKSAKNLEILAEDKNNDVRAAVARNEKTPEGALLKLAKDKILKVRLTVTENASATENVLLKLIEDENNSTVRFTVAERKMQQKTSY